MSGYEALLRTRLQLLQLHPKRRQLHQINKNSQKIFSTNFIKFIVGNNLYNPNNINIITIISKTIMDIVRTKNTHKTNNFECRHI